jgi:hypothetical protein
MEGFLGSEVVDDRGEIGSRSLGNLAGRCAVEAVKSEHIEGRFDKPLPRIGAAVALGATVVSRGPGTLRFRRRRFRGFMGGDLCSRLPFVCHGPAPGAI